MNSKPTVLFVCLGNICRSPAAEGILAKMLKDRGLDEKYQVRSTGTNGYHVGQLPDPRMRESALKRGYALVSRASCLSSRDLSESKLVIAMDRQNMNDINRIASDRRGDIRMLSEFLGTEWPRDVPDPYYGEEDGFEYVLDMLEAACPKIIDLLEGRDQPGG